MLYSPSYFWPCLGNHRISRPEAVTKCMSHPHLSGLVGVAARPTNAGSLSEHQTPMQFSGGVHVSNLNGSSAGPQWTTPGPFGAVPQWGQTAAGLHLICKDGSSVELETQNHAVPFKNRATLSMCFGPKFGGTKTCCKLSIHRGPRPSSNVPAETSSPPSCPA